MNVNATLSPDDLARACAEAMWKDDDASQGLGMEILDVKAGQATLAMTVKPHMVNGHGIAHGGLVFALADTAFAYVCNGRNLRSVAAQASIVFLDAARDGEILTAECEERALVGRSGVYDVKVTGEGGRAIAEFQGFSRSIGGQIIGDSE